MADKIITLFTTPLLEKDQHTKIIIETMIQKYFQNSPGYHSYLRVRQRNFQPRGRADEKTSHAFSECLEFVIHIVLSMWPRGLKREVEKQMLARGRANGIFDDINYVNRYKNKCVCCNGNDNNNNDKYVIDAALLDFLGEECQLDLQYLIIRFMKNGVTYLWQFVHKLLLQDDYQYYAELIKVCNHLVKYYTVNAYNLDMALPAALKMEVEKWCNRKSIDFFKKSRYWPHYSGYLLFDILQYDDSPCGMDNLSQLYDAFEKRVTMKDQRVLPKPHSVIAMLEQMVTKWFKSRESTGLPVPHAKVFLTMKIDYRATGDADNIRQFVDMLRTL